MTNQPLFADMPDLTEKPAVPKPQAPEPLSVSALSQALKGLVETNFSFVRVKGEISGLKKAASGHLYFSLKDDEAVLNGICWRGGATKLSVAPQDGLEVVCTGKITTYPGRSNYQMIVDSMEAAGEGALLKLLEERRKKLLAEGLFAPERKKKIPFLPEVIGVVTSPSGAVIRDIMHRLNDRFPRRVLLWGALMQGDGAAEQVAAGIRGFNAIPPQGLDTPSGHIPRPDVLIVARGGGSLEDLWAFNEEIVVRAAAESDIPLISAVGHETDTTLIDYAADLRAPTPTGAAEKAVPVRSELQTMLKESEIRLMKAARRLLDERQTVLTGLSRGLPPLDRTIAEYAQRLDDKTERLNNALTVLADRKKADLDRLRPTAPDLLLSNAEKALFQTAYPLENLVKAVLTESDTRLTTNKRLLESCSYERVLDRGFALVLDVSDKPIICAADARQKSEMTLKFADGTLAVFPHKPKKKKEDSPQQGTLPL